MATLIKNATLVNEGSVAVRDVFIKDGRIEHIGNNITPRGDASVIDATGCYLLPGIIDDQVHFREPGLTAKATIASESRAAVAGGVTSFMEMPNTRPPALTRQLLEDKYEIAKHTSVANYSFYMGVSNDNSDEVLRINDKRKNVCGVKIFMGSSTGAMLVDNYLTLDRIFGNSELLIATHCEDENIIAINAANYPNADNASYHPLIRDENACFESSFKAVQLAKKYGSRLHILHITTAKELQLFTNMMPLAQKTITAEVCVHHLHFTSDDYARLGNQIKCNPAIKAPENKAALWEALLDGRLDVIATDHAPHTWEEKQLPYKQAPAGLPLVQHALPLMMRYVKEGKMTLPFLVEKMCHAPAECFRVAERGYIREGYFADLVLVNDNHSFTVNKENILYKCAWSPLEGEVMSASITHTLVNGNVVYENGMVSDRFMGNRMTFDR